MTNTSNKTRILLCGYGNINRTLHKILEKMEEPESFSVGICDLKDGNDIKEYLPAHLDEYDLVINACGAASASVMQLCVDLGIDYIDLGYDDGADSFDKTQPPPPPLTSFVIDSKNYKCSSRVLLGFGINPGILEYVYVTNKPDYPHLAFELENDGSYTDNDDMFGTWSPVMYAGESFMCNKYIGVGDKAKQIFPQEPVVLKCKNGEDHEYLFIEHEELYSMLFSDPNCKGVGYLYQSPMKLQRYCLNLGRENLTLESVQEIPVLANVKGKDKVGIFFWELNPDGTLGKRNYWVYNETDNEWAWKNWGENSICWQTATGAWIAYKLIGKIEKGHAYSMTDIAARFRDEITALLNRIGLTFQREDQEFSYEEFKEKVFDKFFAD